MCGIAGIINIDPNKIQVAALKQMTDSIAHRGPDGEGFWISDDANTAFGHRRLSIIDLSNEAAQPMHYLNRYTIIFNGEIYNYVELKNDLLKKGYKFKTQSDTEVLMALYDAEKENCFQFIDGMFSFAIHDNKEKKILCARDRFGEKPFYYMYNKNKSFVFASEIKALRSYVGNLTVNNNMLYNYLAMGYLYNKDNFSETFYQDVLQLPHSHYIIIDTQKIEIQIKRYWDINTDEIDNLITVEQAKEKFIKLFYTSVDRRLRSDVNVGSSLSGGIDSSLIVCTIDDLLKKNKASHSFASSAFKQKTFSACFPGFKRDEGKYIQMIIDETNVEPHYTYPTEETLLADINNVAHYQDEPFGGTSILVQYEVMKLAKKNDVTVLLDGQGADEILAGYHWYFNVFFRQLELFKKNSIKNEYNSYISLHKNNTINARQKRNMEYMIRKIIPNRIQSIKRSSVWLDQKINRNFNPDFFDACSKGLFVSSTSFNDLNKTLYDSTMNGDLQILLRYCDRNSMAFSREVRLPFLSHELVKFLFSLPIEYKIHNGWTKWIMRESFSHMLPKNICWRLDKIGYEPPQKKWLQNIAVKEQIIESRKKLVSDGILNKQILKKTPGEYSSREKGDKSWEHLMAGYLISK